MTDQTPDNSAPAQPVQPPAPLAPPAAAAPGGPSGPVPPKKGMPGWAIGLIIGGAALVILLIVGVVIAVNLIVPKADTTAEPTSSPITKTEEPAQEPVDPGASSDNVTLDDSALFDGPPVWSAPILAGWDIVTFDEGGINRFKDSASGCTFMTSQNLQKVDTSSTSDRSTTQKLATQLQESITSRTTEAEVIYSKSVDLSKSLAGSGPTIEFATVRVDYSVDSNNFSSVFFARSMPASGSYMFTQLECMKTIMDSSTSPLDELTSKISVSSGY